MAANCVYRHRIIGRDTFVAMINSFINYQHTYMCMLIIIRMIYILQKNEVLRTSFEVGKVYTAIA